MPDPMPDLIDPSEDPLNGPFEVAETLKEVVDLYLKKALAFHLDTSSGGERERAEQFIKFIVALASPTED